MSPRTFDGGADWRGPAATRGSRPEALAWLIEDSTARARRGDREVAGGYKMAPKGEHHDAVRTFVHSLKRAQAVAAGTGTLAVIAYKQPATAPEIMEIRGGRGRAY